MSPGKFKSERKTITDLSSGYEMIVTCFMLSNKLQCPTDMMVVSCKACYASICYSNDWLQPMGTSEKVLGLYAP